MESVRDSFRNQSGGRQTTSACRPSPCRPSRCRTCLRPATRPTKKPRPHRTRCFLVVPPCFDRRVALQGGERRWTGCSDRPVLYAAVNGATRGPLLKRGFRAGEPKCPGCSGPSSQGVFPTVPRGGLAAGGPPSLAFPGWVLVLIDASTKTAAAAPRDSEIHGGRSLGFGGRYWT